MIFEYFKDEIDDIYDLIKDGFNIEIDKSTFKLDSNQNILFL